MGSNKLQQSPEKGGEVATADLLKRLFETEEAENINWGEVIRLLDEGIQKARNMGVDEESIHKLEEQKKLILAIKEGRLDIAEAVEMVKLIHSTNKFSDPV